jgi:hypothetical protein
MAENGGAFILIFSVCNYLEHQLHRILEGNAMKMILLATLVTLGFVASTIASAQGPEINPCKIDSLVLNTGWNHATGSVETEGDNSSFWEIIAESYPGLLPRPATVVSVYPGWGSMPSSAWISGSVWRSLGVAGNLDFQACFCLNENPGTVRFSADILTDNTSQVFVNGNATPIVTLTSLKSFTSPAKHVDVDITSMVHPGRNCIVVRVNNVSGPMGLNLHGAVSASNPGSLMRPGCCGTSAVPVESELTVESARLSVHPNPAGAEATIALRVDALIPSATLVVCDVSGRELIRLMDSQRLMPGDHHILIATSDLPSGTYYVTLKSERGGCTQPLRVVH